MNSIYLILLFLHFVGLALGLGTNFAFMALGIATKDMALPDRGAFMLRAFALSRNGSIGLALLVLSGLGMVMYRGGFPAVAEQAGWPFRIKLILVVILISLVGYMQVLIKRAKRDKGGPSMAKIPKLGPFALLTALGIAACAVLAFR
ncbi:MAG TPA: hypothetical protein DCQ83_01860 [Fibrobacteres bacterium]|jgi:uncharacterized membrane protein|nr:hypothetical protein [Fibrobacterota bacterium]